MNRNDVIDVLTLVAAADRRTVGKADVLVWQEVIGELPRDEAIKAVNDHRKQQPGVWLEPGHVYQRVRAAIRDRLEREPDQYWEARQRILEAKVADKGDEDLAPFIGPLRHARPEVNALVVRCPHCHAGPMQRCTAHGGGRPYGGTHPSRLDAARDEQDVTS